MSLDGQQQRMSALPYDPIPQYAHLPPPQFTNPWAASNAIYGNQLSLDLKPHLARLPAQVAPAMGSYVAAPPPSQPAAAGSSSSGMPGSEPWLTDMQDLLSPARSLSSSAYSDTAFSNTSSPVHPYLPTSAPFNTMGYAQAPTRSAYALPSQVSRHSSIQSDASSYDAAERIQRQHSLADFDARNMSQESSRAFAEHVEASKGMLAMSQDTTPRNIYGVEGRAGRGSADSYGFPPTHSSQSSISSASGGYGGSYMTPSVASSVSDFSGTGSDLESAAVVSRSCARQGLYVGAAAPPAPQSMMSQFSSKVSCSTTKKHKCKVCDKRFTRPSSLQTHMYSHTGEKRTFEHIYMDERRANVLQHLCAKWMAVVVTFPSCRISAGIARCTKGMLGPKPGLRIITRSTRTRTSPPRLNKQVLYAKNIGRESWRIPTSGMLLQSMLILPALFALMRLNEQVSH